ncbi:ABC transporter ATP-binding protein [Clostridium paraputrificum]|uniref:ABC transporter ATP-binding protein n=1 Tax=Clostridium TaxID=1485 RepID=UPI003D3373D2
MKKELLKARNICKSYANDGLQNHVLNHVDLDIYEGDFTIIMGSSGSGKSTLLYSLSGMDSINNGEVILGDKSIYTMKTDALAKFRRERIGFVFQQMHLVSNLSIFENVAVPGYLVSKTKEVNNRAKELLDKFGLKDLYKRLPSQVSGGQQQRASVARALINNPELIFADEPTGALNSKAGKEVLDVLTEINRGGQSILMVTHDIKAALRGNRIIYIEDGRIEGELNLEAYKDEARKSRETQIFSWLSSKGW